MWCVLGTARGEPRSARRLHAALLTRQTMVQLGMGRQALLAHRHAASSRPLESHQCSSSTHLRHLPAALRVVQAPRRKHQAVPPIDAEPHTAPELVQLPNGQDIAGPFWLHQGQRVHLRRRRRSGRVPRRACCCRYCIAAARAAVVAAAGRCCNGPARGEQVVQWVCAPTLLLSCKASGHPGGSWSSGAGPAAGSFFRAHDAHKPRGLRCKSPVSALPTCQGFA